MIVVKLANNPSHSQDLPMDLNMSQLNRRHNPPYFFHTHFSFPSHIHISNVFYTLKVFEWVGNVVIIEEVRQTQNFTWET